MSREIPAIPRSLNLTQVCLGVSKACLELFSCEQVAIIVQDEHGWRMYELDGSTRFKKKRLTSDPKERIMQGPGKQTIIELKGPASTVGWIVLPQLPQAMMDHQFLTMLQNELAPWLIEVRKYREARRQAVKDGLTDLFNYRYFIEALQREIASAKKFCSLIVMDVDDFKKYNDHFGHLKGSSLLKEIGTILRRSSSGRNLVAKYGGDEFAVILPEVSKEESFLIAQGIRHRIERHAFPGEEESQPNGTLTISGGVATYPVDAADAFRLFDQADHAMYEAKRRGKNRMESTDQRTGTPYI